jgi:hypothetical protein
VHRGGAAHQSTERAASCDRERTETSAHPPAAHRRLPKRRAHTKKGMKARFLIHEQKECLTHYKLLAKKKELFDPLTFLLPLPLERGRRRDLRRGANCGGFAAFIKHLASPHRIATQAQVAEQLGNASAKHRAPCTTPSQRCTHTHKQQWRPASHV